MTQSPSRLARLALCIFPQSIESITMACCGKNGGLGWATPLEAFEKGEREKLLYIVAVNPEGTK